MNLGLTIGSVFSGIGGLDLGLERAGVGHVSWFCESDPYCGKVLSRHWPGVPVFDDIREMGPDVPRVDVLAGGFPCQDISTAGKGAGIQGERSGLFFELIRVAMLVRPRFIVLENVPAISSRGLDTVLGTLAQSGYDAFWRCFSAGDVGSPQRRLRWWCVAYPDRVRESQPKGSQRDQRGRIGHRCPEHPGPRPEPGLGGSPTGIPRRLDAHRWPAPPGPQHEWEPPRTRERRPTDTARLRALGNAVVPQCAEIVGRWVVEMETARRQLSYRNQSTQRNP